MTQIPRHPQPILMGEVILDRFPAGVVVLGGAPLIVSWHLQGLGAAPCLITRVGQDPEAEQVRGAMASWGIDPRGLQIDPDHPTGTVTVSLEQGQPTFEILPDQAYDFIEPEGVFRTLISIEPLLLYHGTLATRIPFARQVLSEVHHRTQLPIFLDLNLRDPWWDRDWIEQVLAQARWVKVNQSELAAIFEQPQIPTDRVPAYAQALQRRHGYGFLIVTLGEDGAVLALPDRILTHPAPQVEVVDTVGAGDAFSAVAILGIQQGWSPEQILKRGLRFASEICGRPGGTTRDRDLYARYREAWGS